MSYINTKPRWCKTVEATEQGWINSLNGELLVSLRGLKSLIAAEQAASIAAAATIPVVQPVQEVVIMQEEVQVELKEVQVPLKEETVKKPKKKQKLLGEVVEFPTDAKVIGE